MVGQRIDLRDLIGVVDHCSLIGGCLRRKHSEKTRRHTHPDLVENWIVADHSNVEHRSLSKSIVAFGVEESQWERSEYGVSGRKLLVDCASKLRGEGVSERHDGDRISDVDDGESVIDDINHH